VFQGQDVDKKNQILVREAQTAPLAPTQKPL